MNAAGGGTDTTQIVATVPANSILEEVGVKIVTAFDGDTTKELKVGDGTTANAYIHEDDVDETSDNDTTTMTDPGNANQTIGPQIITTDTSVTVTWTNTANASAGKALVWVTYTPAHRYGGAT